ncbi:MAG: 5-deoxy-glucuronate isomerase [Bacteroidetes bacterium]|nr:5-deoxy-glucuronate isomerase [Bacteroidota bacterium]
MIPSRHIGPIITAPPLSATQRRLNGRAVVPGSDALRTVELFDTRGTMNKYQEVITAGNSSFKFLRMARVILDPTRPSYEPVRVKLPQDAEAIFYVNRGKVHMETSNASHTLGMGDLVYAGIGDRILISAKDGICDVSEYRAIHCHTRYPTVLVRHSEIEGTPLAANVGTKRPMSKRTVYKLVDQNIQACRLLFGDTFIGQRGGVGSYPPHFHGPDGPSGLGAEAKEEIYHFRCASDIEGDTPYVLQNCARPPEKVNTYVHVFDEQAINVTPNYHDTIAPPSVDFMFVWCLGAFTENVRDWSAIVTRPGYENEW